jgi:hypothetical protein
MRPDSRCPYCGRVRRKSIRPPLIDPHNGASQRWQVTVAVQTARVSLHDVRRAFIDAACLVAAHVLVFEPNTQAEIAGAVFAAIVSRGGLRLQNENFPGRQRDGQGWPASAR